MKTTIDQYKELENRDKTIVEIENKYKMSCRASISEKHIRKENDKII